MQCLTSRKRVVVRNRRRSPRIGFDCPLRWNQGGADRTGWTRDLSENGVGFITRTLSAPSLGQRIRVVLELDEEHEWPVDTEARVVHSEPQGHGLCAVGLQLRSDFH